MIKRDFPFKPFIMAVQRAYEHHLNVRISLFGQRPISGEVSSVSKEFFVLRNDYSETIVPYEEIRLLTVYDTTEVQE